MTYTRMKMQKEMMERRKSLELHLTEAELETLITRSVVRDVG